LAGTQPQPSPAAPAAAVPQQAHSLTLSSSFVFLTALVIQILGVVASIFLYKNFGANTAGQALIGTAQLFLLVGSSINGIGDLRIGAAYTFFLARGKRVTDNTGTYLVIRTLMVCAASLILFVIAPLEIGPFRIAQPAELESLGIFLCLPILWSFSTVYSQMFVGLGNSLRAQLPGLVEAIVRLPLLFYVAYYVGFGPHTLLWITIAYAVGASSSAIYSVSAVWSRVRRVSLSETLYLFRYAWPLMGGLMLNYLVVNMVPLTVVAWLGAAKLSVFLAANGWRVLVLSLPTAVATPLYPYLAGLHKQERYELVRSGTWHALRYTAILLIPGVVALVTYRYPFLVVFANHSYAAQGAWPLAVLVVAAIPLAFCQVILTTLDSIGKRRLELYITAGQVLVLIAAIVLLVSPARLIPAKDGIIGAAIAVLLSGCVALGLNTYFMETLIRVHIEAKSIARITLSAAASFASLSLLNRARVLPIGAHAVAGGLELLGAVVLGFAVYFVILAAAGELTKEDVRRIGSSLGLPKVLYEPVTRLCWVELTPSLPPVDRTRAPGLRSPEFPEPFTGTTELPGMVDAEIRENGEDTDPSAPDGRR
jgi:O-antigen/teichoic acid export membrane protein